MREVVKSSWFARLDLILVILSGVVWLLWPDYVGASPILLLLLPWLLRVVSREFPFQRTPFDWLLLLFLVAVWVGYWASYDEVSALNKAWMLTTSFFLYYALSAQPEENIIWITSGLFVIGVGVSVYFFLTYDFVNGPHKVEMFRSLGAMWMRVRPHLSWIPIHPNYASGVALLTGIFGLYPLQKFGRDSLAQAGILTGFFAIFLALVMAASRGVVMALVSGCGIWLLWRFVNFNGIKLRLGKEAFFPVLVLIYLGVVVAVLYIGPANSPSSVVGSPIYGADTRAELFTRSLYFLEDYPITGAGLATFPGLYSQYMLAIPYFYVINSHNLFLDVFIEQGVLGGAAFLLLYIFCIWYVSRAVARNLSAMQFLNWLVLCALIMAVIHGMVDDYLYNGKGAILSLFLIGLSMIVIRNGSQDQIPDTFSYRQVINPMLQRYALVLFAALIIFVGINFKRVRAMWYADLGAVQLAKVELDGFPETGWFGLGIVPKLDQADASLRTALELDPLNRTANHRLGLLSILRRDYSSAVVYLGRAYTDAPGHRGIVKSLGFSYVWLGETDNAISLLKDIPETKNELDVYRTWWQSQGRDDLSARAIAMYQILDTLPVQP